MFKNYIKLALRNLANNKVFSLINVTGLSLGIAVCITILLFVQYEKSFDQQHTKNIYRLNEIQSPEGMTNSQKVALSMYPAAEALKLAFPQVKDYVRIFPYEKAGLKYGDKKLFLDNVFWADKSFFNIFDYKLLKGSAGKVLEAPNSVVLTEESAQKFFGTEDPIGKVLETHNLGDTLHFTVTGVMQNVPATSHLQFNAIYSLDTYLNIFKKRNGEPGWYGNWVITYLKLADHTDAKRFEAGLPAFLAKNTNPDFAKHCTFFLQSLKEVHGQSGDITHDYHNFQKFDSSYTRIFLIIALIVLIIACVNFINLSTAKSAHRAKEVGVRKSIGAQRSQLIFQFMSESLLLCFVAMLLAIVLVALFLPVVNKLSDHELSVSFIRHPDLLAQLVAATIVVGLVSGLYPALYLSSFRPIKVLKSSSGTGRSKSFLRNALVVSQFACASFLIISTVFVIRQLNFMRTKDPGFKTDQVLIISGAYRHYKELKTALEQSPLIKGVTGSSQSLGNNFHQTGFNYKNKGPWRNLVSSHVVVDEDFISFYQIKLVAGKNFSKDGGSEEFIVNESLAKELLKDDPKGTYESLIGAKFGADDTSCTIVGVAKDFNFNSLHTKIETLCLVNFKRWGFHDVSVKIDGGKSKEAIAFVKKTYEHIIPNYPFDYQFLDEHFAQLYRNDEKVSKVVSVLGILAIIIACLGLLGLASYAAETRTKEIGIRKVLGATVSNVVNLLSKEFIKLVLLANLIAWPLGYYLMTLWLRDYAYHIDLSWWVFGLAGFASLLIALITVSSQTFRAAIANPVKSLRTDA